MVGSRAVVLTWVWPVLLCYCAFALLASPVLNRRQATDKGARSLMSIPGLAGPLLLPLRCIRHRRRRWLQASMTYANNVGSPALLLLAAGEHLFVLEGWG
jgi:hypothetical protein